MNETEIAHWRTGLPQFDIDNELVALAVIAAFMKPISWLDVGCGTGQIVKTALLFDIDAFGVDQIQEDSRCFKQADLTQPLDLGRQFQLVSCIEMVEHLPEEYEGVICDTLARHVTPGGILILTSALPGQEGYNHFNCQEKSYWRDRLQSRGMILNKAYTERLEIMWKHTHSTLNHLHKNVQVFSQPGPKNR